MRFTVAAFALAAFATAANATAPMPPETPQPTTREFLDANCRILTPGCLKPIHNALLAAAITGRTSSACFGHRPEGLVKDVAIWLAGHHEFDNEPLGKAVPDAADVLWPCVKAI